MNKAKETMRNVYANSMKRFHPEKFEKLKGKFPDFMNYWSNLSVEPGNIQGWKRMRYVSSELLRMV